MNNFVDRGNNSCIV